MAYDFIVNIAQSAAPGRAAFGIPMIASAKAGKEVDYMTYTNLNDLAKDFAADTDVYKAAQLLWAQDMKPRKIAVHAVTGDELELTGAWMNEDWRQLIVIDPGSTTKVNIAKAIEATDNKFYFTSVAVDGPIADDTAFITAWKKAIEPFAAFTRTMVMYYPNTWLSTVGTAAEKISMPAQEGFAIGSSGKKVSDLISSDTRVLSDGSVVGTLKKVTGFTEFDKQLKDGHFFPFTIDIEGAESKKMTWKKDGKETRIKDSNFEKNNVIKVEKSQKWEIIVDGKPVITFDFSHAEFEN